MTSNVTNEFVLKFKSPDQPGIISKVSPVLYSMGCDIRDAIIYGCPSTSTFFVRMQLQNNRVSVDELETVFQPLKDKLELTGRFFNLEIKPRVLIAVSKFDHCLHDILHKTKIGWLPIDIVGIVSNHDTLKPVAEWHDIPYYHLPISPETKSAQEAEFQNLIQETKSDLVVLARYMQILSDDFSKKLEGKCINIHHSFLPSFKGAKPYHQAYNRGVKIIGATAHYVTADLDEGPIIEQDIRRVTHATTAKEMVEIGKEVEASVLSRALKWHVEHRVFRNGARTVVLT